MPVFIKARNKKRRTLFVTKTARATGSDNASCSLCLHRPKVKTEGIAPPRNEMMANRHDDDKMPAVVVSAAASSADEISRDPEENCASVADAFMSFRPIRDRWQTKTSILQDETMEECLSFLAGVEDSRHDSAGRKTSGVPKLQRERHVEFLRRSLKTLRADYVGFDASRPWILYWVLAGLALLGEDVQQYQERLFVVVQCATSLGHLC
jgi:protein farnesyltransferase subunit beta